MKSGHILPMLLCGLAAGAVNGLFGAGGGMVLIPLLGMIGKLQEEELFPSCLCIILPLCLVSLLTGWVQGTVTLSPALPYLPGSAIGGLLAGFFGRKIPVKWLHRVLGVLILWGGVRYLLG